MMIGAAFLFASMGVAVKLAAAWYASSEIVMYRGVIGMTLMGLLMWRRGEGLSIWVVPSAAISASDPADTSWRFVLPADADVLLILTAVCDAAAAPVPWFASVQLNVTDPPAVTGFGE